LTLRHLKLKNLSKIQQRKEFFSLKQNLFRLNIFSYIQKSSCSPQQTLFPISIYKSLRLSRKSTSINFHVCHAFVIKFPLVHPHTMSSLFSVLSRLILSEKKRGESTQGLTIAMNLASFYFPLYMRPRAGEKILGRC
jgi:hypothetical protein